MEQAFGNILETWSYLGLFVVLMIAGFGVPLPEDIPLILSGLLVATSENKLNLYLMMLTGLAGVVVGDSTLFFLGRRYGMGIMQLRGFRRVAKPWLLEKAQKQYENHGAKILFAARFMPGLRAVLFLTAGIFRVPYWKLLVFDGGAAVLSVPLWIWAGYYFGKLDQIQRVFRSAEMVSYIVIGATIAAVLIGLVWMYIRKRRAAALAAATTIDAGSECSLTKPAFNDPAVPSRTKDVSGKNTRPLAAPPR